MKYATNDFQQIEFTQEEEVLARRITVYTFAYIQNKKAEYARQILGDDVEYNDDPAKNLKAIVRHEKLKMAVDILDELLAEFQEHVTDSLDISQTQPQHG